MSPDPAAIARRVRRLLPRSLMSGLTSQATGEAALPSLESYKDDPVGFARDVLGIELTPDQKAIITSLPGRVKVESGHNLGKSHVMAVAVLWWFYSRPQSLVICTAPKAKALEDVLWATIRTLWANAKRPLTDYFVGPKAPEMYDNPNHWAKGYTSSKTESSTGRHQGHMLHVYDEDEALEPMVWTATASMYKPDQGHGWIASCNPTTTASQSYLESQHKDANKNPKWKLFQLSSLNHPNIKAQLRGEPPPIPNAVTLDQVDDWISRWTTRLSDNEDRMPNDVEWPPQSGVYYRPGPNFMSRVLGRRPTSGVDTVWSELAWERAITPKFDPHEMWRMKFVPKIGIDPAAYGDDDTSIHVRIGPLSLHHEAHNGWGPDRTAGRTKELCRHYAAWFNSLAESSWDRPQIESTDIEVTIEGDGGYGVAVHSHADDYSNWHLVSAGGGSELIDPEGRPLYRNKRSELWFNSSEMAFNNRMDLSRLPQDVLDKLRMQLLSPFYKVEGDGSRMVEKRDDIKERLGRSPDDATALIVCYSETLGNCAPRVLTRDGSWGR